MATTAIKERATKETGLLMSGPLVLATLHDLKQQTRRLRGLEEINSDPNSFHLHRVGIIDPYVKPRYRGRFGAYFHRKVDRELQIWPVVCPYGQPGDRLWVRETWQQIERNPRNFSEYAIVEVPFRGARTLYSATLEGEEPPAWRSPIHMPRWASRITLEITDVRVQRVQEISAKDILAEGAVLREHHNEYLGKCPISAFNNACYPDLKSLWADGWNAINAKRGCGWEKNCWVWAISFKRVQE